MSRSHPARRTAAALAGSAAVLLIAASPAAAERFSITGGSTTLRLDSGAARALDGLGVSVAPTGRARSGSSGISFPITRGSLDPANANGVIRHSGGLRLRAGRTSVTLSDYTVAINKGSTMSARVNGGSRLGALVPVVGKARISRNGLGLTVSNVDIHLSTRGAAALNRAFKTRAFRPRLKLGTVTTRTSLGQVAFNGGATSLALDPGAAGALTSLGIAPGLIGPATVDPDGAFAFPITGGKVNARTLGGQIQHSGGVSLTRGGVQIRLTDFNVDTRNAQLVATINGATRVAILNLGLTDPSVAVARTTVTVGNVPARLTAVAAGALNQAFGTTAFAEGLTLGVATVRGAIR
jgi:hypothetical protein